MNDHVPVLADEVVQFLAPRREGRYVDCTIGCGGHAAKVLERGAGVIGLDWDERALAVARERLRPFSDKLMLFNASYTELGNILRREGVEKVDGMLVDCGMSSLQVDDASRGFSFQRDGPLDMRMSAGRVETAAKLLRRLDERELERIFRELGGERQARKIARAIGNRRGSRPLERTLELVELILRAYPIRCRGRIHPATRVFQSLRITVNGELENLKFLIENFDKYLCEGGRFAAITFHSLEDRIVKHGFREKARAGVVRILTKKPVIAGTEETAGNPRSRSAKLRVVERVRQGEAYD